MEVSVESIGNLQRRLTVAVPEDRVSEAVNLRLKDLARSVRLKGFRPGKVPMGVVQQRYGKQVRQEVVGDLVQSTFVEAVTQQELRPAGNPEIDASKTGASGGLEYTATFEVYPEIEPAPLKGVKVEVPTAQVGDEDLAEMLETIRRQHQIWEAREAAAEEGDRVTIDYTGSIDGEPFAGNEGTDVQVEIGKGRLIAGFEQGLIGAQAGEERTLDLQFPEEYHAAEVAGKPVQFAVKVKQVEAAKLPEVDSDLARKLGVQDGDVDKMRDEIRANMARELETRLQARVKQAVMDKLLEINAIDVPAALVEGESANLAAQMEQNLRAQGMGQNDLKLEPKMFQEQAQRRVTLGLLLAEIVKRQQFSVSPEKVRAHVEKMAEAYERPDEVVKWYYGDQQRLAEMESIVLEEAVVDWVLSEAETLQKSMSFKEITAPQSEATEA